MLKIYVYKVTFEEIPHWYWGVHREKSPNDGYMGSPTTHKWMWDFYTPHLQICQLFDYTDEGWYQARDVESRIIRPDLNNPLCLNENCGGTYSREVLRKGVKAAAEAAHRDKDAMGRSLNALQHIGIANEKIHSNRNDEGKSLHALALCEKLHANRDDEGRSLHTLKLHEEKDDEGRSLHAKMMAQARWGRK